MRRIRLMVALIAIGNASLMAANSELRFYPVENGTLLIQQHCQKNSKLAWTTVLSESTRLTAGEKVVVLTDKELVPATLGDLECFAGECGDNYVSVALTSQKPGVVMLAVLKGTDATGLQAVPVEVNSVHGQCEEVLSQMSHEYFSEIEDKRRCEVVSVSGKPLLLRATKEFMQENGWPISTSRVRVISMTSNEPVEVDGALTPVLLLQGSNGDEHLVWRAAVGICCPRAITIRSSVIDEAGRLNFGPAYTAGGQPCD